VATVLEVVTGIDPALSTDTVRTAISAAVSQVGQPNQLAWALTDRPELLTGAGAPAPVPSVLRLIDQLCDAGATRIVRPPCPHCRRVIGLHRPISGQWFCRNCVAKSNTVQLDRAAR
jgi:hypothetical protein